MKRDWNEIQKYYDDNHTWRDIIKHFKMSNETLIKAIKNNLLIIRTKSDANVTANIKKTRILSDKTKQKISESRKKYLKEHPDQVPYLLNHSKNESFPEKYFESILTKTKLKYERYLQISIYELDFAFIDKKINLEIDGEQHYTDLKIIESNKNRNSFLENNGWKTIRIRWSDYQKLNRIQKEEKILELIEIIENKIEDFTPFLNGKVGGKYYCKCGNTKSKHGKMCIKCRRNKNS
jgi:very-short-patch-repair endonuclease